MGWIIVGAGGLFGRGVVAVRGEDLIPDLIHPQKMPVGSRSISSINAATSADGSMRS